MYPETQQFCFKVYIHGGGTKTPQTVPCIIIFLMLNPFDSPPGVLMEILLSDFPERAGLKDI